MNTNSHRSGKDPADATAALERVRREIGATRRRLMLCTNMDDVTGPMDAFMERLDRAIEGK